MIKSISHSILFYIGFFLFTALNITAQNILDEDFSTSNSNWQGVSITGGGSFDISNGEMNVTADNNGIYAAYHSEILSGHFDIEVDFGQDDNVGLALFKAMGNGTPDINNFSMIKVDDDNGTPVVSITDRQNVISNVLDNSGVLNSSQKNLRYNNRLDGSTYSLPYNNTNKKLRIFRHQNEQFIHFFYSVSKVIDGVEKTGWIELAPSKEWSQLDGNFLIGLVAIEGVATFDNVIATSKPLNDIDDSNTGFAATWREVNWSGYFGNALVVTFDANDAPLTEGSRKFIFWEAFNNVPAWYLDESLMYTYEFVETWGGGSLGAHEPMSDRLRRFSNVTLDYDGDDFKIIHWKYVLHDADYRWPDIGNGTEKPEVDEYYKIYPDGTILRKIKYKAKLDTGFRNWHELTEMIVITGNVTDPVEHLSIPSLTIWPINSQPNEFIPTGNSANDYEEEHNEPTILAVHLQNHPDLVNAFSDNSSYHETYAGDPITYYKTWHDQYFTMSHWPINKEQYYSDPFKSVNTWKEQIKHTSLAGAGIYENNSSDWIRNFDIDLTDGREFREIISYMALSPKGNLEQSKTNVESWLNDPWNWESTHVRFNMALNKSTTTSSTINSSNTGAKAVDGKDDTRWESDHGSDIEWIYVDLEMEQEIYTVVLNWEESYSSAYRIEVSNDASNWEVVYSDSVADGGLHVIELPDVSGRYVRIYGTDRASQYGHSLFEIKLYGDAIPPTVSVKKNEIATDIKVFPNPVNDKLNIYLKNQQTDLFDFQLISLDGKIVASDSLMLTFGESHQTIDVSNLGAGIYIVRLVSGSETYTSKVLIE